MAFPQKKSRKINVLNHSYQWLVANTSQKNQKKILITQGHSLLGHLYDRKEREAITPGDIRRLIIRALNDGWVPTKPGKEFRLKGAFCFQEIKKTQNILSYYRQLHF